MGISLRDARLDDEMIERYSVLYLLALVAPPLACLCAGRFWHFVLNLVLCLTLYGIPIAMVHAWYVVKAASDPFAGRGGRGGNSGQNIVIIR